MPQSMILSVAYAILLSGTVTLKAKGQPAPINLCGKEWCP